MTVDEMGEKIFGKDWEYRKKIRYVREAIEGTLIELGKTPASPSQSRIDFIFQAVFESIEAYYGYTREDLNSMHRIRRLSDARMLAIYLAKKFTGLGDSQLTRIFNFRDRSTIIWYGHRLQELFYLKQIQEDILTLETMIKTRLEKWQEAQLQKG